jgi:hypothetical protein
MASLVLPLGPSSQVERFRAVSKIPALGGRSGSVQKLIELSSRRRRHVLSWAQERLGAPCNFTNASLSQQRRFGVASRSRSPSVC